MVRDQHWVMSLRRLGSMWQVPLSCNLSPEVGQPDFAPPPEAIKATAEAAVQGLTSYTGVSGLAFCPVWKWQKCQLLCGDMQCPTLPAGTLELRTAISEYLEKYKKVPAIHESLGPEAQRCMSHWLTALNIIFKYSHHTRLDGIQHKSGKVMFWCLVQVTYSSDELLVACGGNGLSDAHPAFEKVVPS